MDLAAGRLVQVAEAGTLGPDFYLVRKRSAPVRQSVDAVWDWCLHRLLLPQRLDGLPA
jgi:LysR family glycine cleavage system transcriptional activator